MQYTSIDIAKIINAEIKGGADKVVNWLLTDSRSLAFPETTAFFALTSASGDGHKYIPDLYKRGVRSFIVSQLPANYTTDFSEATFLKVENTLTALQRLAKFHREQFRIPVVGITGSNGKTLVKEWLYNLTGSAKRVVRSPRSYNSQIGVPLSVSMLNEHTEIGIFEAGISRSGEMQSLEEIIQPTIGILTNIGAAHQENFSSLSEKCEEKLKLFSKCRTIIYDADDTLIASCMEKLPQGVERLGWSRTKTSAPLRANISNKNETSTTLHYIFEGKEGTYTIPFTDEASAWNSVHCLAAALKLGIDSDLVARNMEKLEPVAMRLEVKRGTNGCTIINDTYNSDLTSLDIALNFMARRPNPENHRRTLILSDIDESGLSPDELYSKVADMVNRRGVERFIGVGQELSQQCERFEMENHFFTGSKELIESGLLQTLHDEIVLLKGSRRFGFEELGELMSQKVHETTLEINLEALARNLNYYRSMLRPQTKMVCMVKASAYGTGSIEVAKTLQDRGVDYLAVAVADEGADLRMAGITRNIIIMNPEMSSFNLLFEYDLEPEVYNFELLEALIAAARKHGITNFPIHVKVDTGMHRLGFHPDQDIEPLIARLKSQQAVIVRSVFSHFVGSDSPDFDEFSTLQFERFDRASSLLCKSFDHKILRHICNSAGIERFAERQLDMVRLGLGLYGIDPIDNRTLNNVASLKTTILQIRNVPAGDSIGYSRRTFVERDSRIAAIPIGYADGLNRHLGNRNGYCLVNGQQAQYVGNICMDVCMIDVTDIPCREGDTVEIFGDRLPVAVLSDKLDTIPYEILTGISERVKRVYFQE